MKNPYILTGVVLLIIGLYLTAFSYFALDSTPLTAIGISTLIVAFTSIWLANTRPKISPEASQIILQTGLANSTATLQALDVKNKAIYMPPNGHQDSPRALVPLTGEPDIRHMQVVQPHEYLTTRKVDSQNLAVAITTPGTLCLNFLKSKPGASKSEIESASSYVLTRVLDIASRVNVGFSNPRINIEVRGTELGDNDSPFYRCAGSPVASIVAAICSQALEKPIRIFEENRLPRKTRIILEVLT